MTPSPGTPRLRYGVRAGGTTGRIRPRNQEASALEYSEGQRFEHRCVPTDGSAERIEL